MGTATGQGTGTRVRALGEGTVNMGTSGQSPYNIKNSGRRVQVMVLASDILTEGGAAGAIQRLAWNIAATGTGAVNGYTIRMAHYTTGGDFFPGTNFFTPSSWTTVYSGNFAPAGTGFQDIIFTSNPLGCRNSCLRGTRSRCT